VLAEIGGRTAEGGYVESLPTHYEPRESPSGNPLYRQAANPTRQRFDRPENPYNPSHGRPGSEVFPYVLTTYRLTEHHTAVHISEYKASTCDIRPGRRPRGAELSRLVEDYRRRAGGAEHEGAHQRG
jgi:anaerobic selenocysteine-containing dehydrogenase